MAGAGLVGAGLAGAGLVALTLALPVALLGGAAALRGAALAGAGRAGFLATEALGFLLMLRACRGVARAVEANRQLYRKSGAE